MFKHFIISFYRQVKFNKNLHLLNFLVIIVGFVILLYIYFFLRNEFKYEHFHKERDSIFRVITVTKTSSEKEKRPFTPGPLGPALFQEFPQIRNVTRYSIENRELLKTKNYSNVFQVARCDKSFFDIFSFELIKGNLEQFNHKSEVIIITENTSKKLFGNENPIGKRIESGYYFNYIVIGVIKDYSKLTHIQFDAITPFTIYSSLDRWAIFQNYVTYVLFKENASFNKNNLKKIRFFLKEHITDYPLLEFQSINDIHLNSDFDDPWVTNKGDKGLIYILITAAIILMFVILFNYFSLSSSLYISRIKEFSIKRVLGLDSNKILIEHILENLLFIIICVLSSLVLFFIINNNTNSLTNFDINSRLHIKIIYISSIVFIFIMLIPAFLTHFLSKINGLNFSLSNFANFGMNPKYRTLGMALQILISVVIIFFAIIISNQLIYIKNKELGYNYKDIVYTPNYWRNKTDDIKDLLLKNPNILSVSAGSDLPINLTFKRKLTNWDGKVTDKNFDVYYAFTDIGFFKTFNIPLLKGSYFSNKFTFDRYFKGDAGQYYLVNETAVKQMELKNPLNTKFTCSGFRGEIIGVVKDFHFKPIQKEIEPLFIQFNPEEWLYLFVKLKENNKETINYIKSTIKKFDKKGYPIEFKVLEEDYNNLYSSIRKISYSAIVFSITAFILSIIGLIAIISFLEKKKQKEFAIKKVFGAQSNRIIRDFIIELSRYIIPAILISSVIGYYATKSWLQGFAYKIAYSYLQLAIILICIYIVIVVLIYFKVRKTSNLNPSETLKYE